MDPLGRPLQVDQVPVVEMLTQQGLAVRPGHSYFEQVPWGSQSTKKDRRPQKFPITVINHHKPQSLQHKFIVLHGPYGANTQGLSRF